MSDFDYITGPRRRCHERPTQGEPGWRTAAPARAQRRCATRCRHPASASKRLPRRGFFGMIKPMNTHMLIVSNRRSVAADAGAAPFAGRGMSIPHPSAVSIIRIIQGR
ncbi:MAG: hypothetical protein QFF03_17970 [Pseudomonadota bacterium]|nr:hypothetical protein [Pseudomonadota bacterium]